jgi:hypothetical protein
MTYVFDNELRADDGTILAAFKTHWQAVAAMIRLSKPDFVSLGGDDPQALATEREMRRRLEQGEGRGA